ncbi:MAG: hypothetical protein KC457_35765, partial [Myxococcales bacterium]|nr:hypothetical protein [Myxococcales bacterium]
GYVWAGNEACDDGNMDDDDACSNSCMTNVDAQCLAPYLDLDLADRIDTFNDGNNNIEYCDRNDSADTSPDWQGGGMWYRFTGAAGVVMPESAPTIYSCGTDAPGWLNGVHPTTDQGVVARQVCFNWGNNTCNWNSNIQVVNCGDFYLYNLVEPPVCYLRYCGAANP